MVVINLRCKKITSSYVDKIISVFALSTIPSSIIILLIESAWIFPPSGFFMLSMLPVISARMVLFSKARSQPSMVQFLSTRFLQ